MAEYDDSSPQKQGTTSLVIKRQAFALFLSPLLHIHGYQALLSGLLIFQPIFKIYFCT